MMLEPKLTLSTCLLALVLSIVSIQSTSSLETEEENSIDRVKRRSYYNPWSGTTSSRNSVSLFEASNVFKAAPYTVPRPYYIPVYGTPGHSLIFYPPQPLYVNPGAPQDNPLTPPHGTQENLPPKESPHFAGGETYLPPKEVPATTLPSKVPPRFGADYDDQDDPNAPVWGSSNKGVVQMPLKGDQDESSGPVPTRAPMSRPSQPPLVHAAQSSGQSAFVAQGQVTNRPNSPPQSLQRTTLRPITSSPPSGPSNCVWAIISCCSAANPSVLPQNCFEQRGCPGPFWGASPCESDYARAAIAAAVNYYNTNPGGSSGK